MSVIETKSLLEQMKWRYATKIFDPTKKIPMDVWKALEEVLVLTPSSFGLQPWKFFVVTDPGIKKKFVAASWNQKQPEDCSHHVVFAIKKNTGVQDAEKYIQSMSKIQGVPLEKLDGFKNVLLGFLSKDPSQFNVNEWATRQVYIALGNFMTAAALLGVDTCPMEGIVPAQYDEILGLPSKGYATVVSCAAGYRSATDKYAASPKVRYSAQDVIERI